MSNKQILCYLGHHKCASTWFEAICHSVCHDINRKFEIYYDASYFGNNLNDHIRKNNIDFFVYANANYNMLANTPDLKGFHIVRDPRDIIVSAYFSHLHSHPTHAWPELVDYRNKLKKVSRDEGIHMEIDFRQSQFDDMRSWRDAKPANIDQYKMEDIIASPYTKMLSIFNNLNIIDNTDFTAKKRTYFFLNKLARKIESKLGLKVPASVEKLPAERFLGIIWENSFEKKTGGRKTGEENVKSHYRKGTPGDWRNYFTQSHINHFKEKYNDILLQYGYENTEDWD